MHSPSRPGALAAPRILISGGAGFIGAALARELLLRGASVLCVDDLSAGRLARLPEHERCAFVLGDVAATGTWGSLLNERAPFDFVVHLAARVGVRAVLRDPAACRRINEEGVRQLVAAIAGLPADRRPRVLAASSSEVYADARAPLAEDAALRAAGAQGRWAYAASKLAGEVALDRAAELWPAGQGPVHLRFFNVVGPGQDAASGMVLATFVERARAGRALPVHGDGRQVRTFAHVSEVARVLADLLAHPALPPGALNVGGVARASVFELAHTVARLAGEAIEIVRVDPRVECGAAFEEVRWREPRLERLRALGIAPPAMGLEEIVRDSLLEPAALAAPTGAAGRPACASPAS